MILKTYNKVIFVVLFAVLPNISNAATQKPKNVLFIVADDLGMLYFTCRFCLRLWLIFIT
jgi:hypothetical protein